MIDDTKFNEIIPTAILTAYPRTLTDIPNYPEIFAELKRYYHGEIASELIIDKLAPELEARHKIIDKLLRETGITQILEIAAGFSPRGLNFAKSNPNAQYVEIDLPDSAEIKQAILDGIGEVPNNLHVIAGNALRKSDFENAMQYFDKNKPVAVINEGLLRYLTFDEKAEFAKNVRFILEQFGGVWITGDGATKAFAGATRSGSVNKTILTQTKRQSLGNAFESQGHMGEFFAKAGFSCEFHDYAEIQADLTTPKKLGLPDDEVRDKLLSYASAIVLKLKGANAR